MAKKIIGFHTDQLSERGTEIALFDYAYFNEKMYGNKSIIFYQENNPNSNKKAIERFKNAFECYSYKEFKEVESIVNNLNIKYFYNIKNDRANKGQRIRNCINLNHAVFELEPHGERYAAISQDLCDMYNLNVPVVPHMINIPKHFENMRSELNIPNNAIVIGRYGGLYEFNISDAHYAIAEILEKRKDIYFIFANTCVFYNHPRIVYLDTIVNLHDKTKFINTCDAMIHARSYGESFGLAIGEFSTLNKPVITTFGKYNAHIKLLGEKGIIFRSKDELVNIFMQIENIIQMRNDWNAFKEYTPEIVMKQFMKVFLQEENDFEIKQREKVVNENISLNKIVVLTIFNDNDYYEKMRKSNEEYLLFLEKNSQIKQFMTLFYIVYKNLNDKEYFIDGNTLYIHGKEEFIPGILEKTLKAMDIVTNKLNINYDFALRTNASAVINYHELLKYIEELNIPNNDFSYIGPFNVLSWYDPPCGIVDNKYHGTRYCGGAFTLLSRKLVLNMIENKEKFVRNVIDDVSIGQYINNLKNVREICIKDKIVFDYSASSNKHAIAYFNNTNKFNRDIDVNNFREQITNIKTFYEKQYSIVIPINPNTSLEHCICYFKLMQKYVYSPDVYKIYVITSKKFIKKIKNKIISLEIHNKIKFVNETCVQQITNLANLPNKHWYYQQLLKLKIANFIKTKHYLTLDIDMFLIKELKYDDMFFDNKIIYTHESFPHNNPPGYTNKSWWENSCKILNCPIEKLHNMDNLMGVTPQLLITNVVNDLIIFLENKFGPSWDTFVANNGFTEFSLYWIYVMERNICELYTKSGTPLLDVDEDVSVLHHSSNEKIIKTVINALNSKKYHFLLVQGWLKIDFRVYSRLLQDNENISDSEQDLEFDEEQDSDEEVQQEPEKINNITLVSAFFDIGRDNFKNYNRSTDEYLKAFFNYLDMEYKMIIFIDDRYLHRVLEYYEKCKFKNKKFVSINKQWLFNNIYAWKQLDKDTRIMTSEFYKTLVEHRIMMGKPETIYSEYNIVNHAKIDFINYAINNNYVDDEFIFWSDFGYYNSILDNKRESFPTNILDMKKLNPKKINCMIRDHILPEDSNMINILLSGKVALIGTFFGGPVNIMKQFQDLYHSCLEELYINNISDDDQHVLLRCYLKNTDFFQLFQDAEMFNSVNISDTFQLLNNVNIATKIRYSRMFNEPKFVKLIEGTKMYEFLNDKKILDFFQNANIFEEIKNPMILNMCLDNGFIFQRGWPRPLNCFQITE